MLSPRGFRLLVALAFLPPLVVAAACGGPDLGKANYQRTTVPATPGATSSVDNAVQPAALRGVDPCGLVDKSTLADMGTVGDTGLLGLDECHNIVKDAGGKSIEIDLKLLDSLGPQEDPTGTVDGLPEVQAKDSNSSCTQKAVVARTDDRTLVTTVQVDYEGGEPCGAANTVLDKVLKKLHAQPPKFPDVATSLTGVDPCAAIDPTVARQMVPDVSKGDLTSLYSCSWYGAGPSVLVMFMPGLAPGADNGYSAVDLGGGVTAYQKPEPNVKYPSCTVQWQHKPLKDGDVEMVDVQYQDYGTKNGSNGCDKAVLAAKSVLAKLPKA